MITMTNHRASGPALKRRRHLSVFAVCAAFLFLTLPVIGGANPPLSEVLGRATHAVERFWAVFPDVDCTEQVLQTKLDPHGKIIYQQQSQYDFLILLGPPGEEFSLNESRLLQKQEGKSKSVPLLITNGFSMLLLVFHPYFQDSFEFDRLPDEQLDGKNLVRLHFQQLKGTRSPSALQLRGRTYPIEWAGTAWIEPETGSVYRIQADLAAPMDDVGLRLLHCDVRYAPVRFSTSSTDYWLPQSAEIEAQTPRQHWRNVHRFTDYKRFATDSRESQRTQP
jgi:hypothetical protein